MIFRTKELKKVSLLISAAFLFLSAAPSEANNTSTKPTTTKPATTTTTNKALKVGVVNFKTCVEGSKYGKQEQSNFEALRKQMEAVLVEKEKTLNEMADKFNDLDYLDSLSPDAETEAKRKFRALSQEMSQFQTQYYQALNQTNIKIIQKLTEIVSSASAKVAEKNKLDILLNEEGGFYYSPALDYSKQVISIMDEEFDKDANQNDSKDAKAGQLG